MHRFIPIEEPYNNAHQIMGYIVTRGNNTRKNNYLNKIIQQNHFSDQVMGIFLQAHKQDWDTITSHLAILNRIVPN